MDVKFKLGPRREISVSENSLDKAIRWLSPVKASARLRARVSMAIAGSYTGASKSRRSLSAWKPPGADADQSLLDDLPTLRDRSRDLIRNAPLAGGALNTVVTSVVGNGLVLRPCIDAGFLGLDDAAADEWERSAQRHWELWANSRDCDISRTQTFGEIQDLVFRSTLEAGDCFTLLPTKPPKSHFPFNLRVQIVEADRVENKDFASDTETLSGGIRRHVTGAPIEYHVLNQHPGSFLGAARDWRVIPAFGRLSGRRNILHHFRRLRPGQNRGLPYFAAVIEAFKQIERYTNAELMAAVVAGMFTVFVKSEAGDDLDVFEPSDETGGAATDDDYKLGNGAVVSLGEGDDITTANPGRPNAGFDPFVMSVLRQIGVYLEIPYEILIKHFTASYSASRAAVLEAWRFFLARREWLAKSLCQPVYEALMDELVASGKITAPGYFTDPLTRAAYLGSKWVGRPQGQIDPLKERKANEIAEDRAWKTAEENTMELTGGDWSENVRQRAKEKAMMVEGGLVGEPAVEEEGDESPDDADQKAQREAEE